MSPSFEAELGFWKYVIVLIFPGEGGIMSEIIIFPCTVKGCKLTNLWTSNNFTLHQIRKSS